MTYEDKVIDAVKSGTIMYWTPELEKLFRLVYRAGHKQGTIDQLESMLNKTNSQYSDVVSDGGKDPR